MVAPDAKRYLKATKAAVEAYITTLHPEVPGGGATISEMQMLAEFVRELVVEGRRQMLAPKPVSQADVRSKLGVDEP